MARAREMFQMPKRTVKQRVDEFITKRPKNVTLSAIEMERFASGN